MENWPRCIERPRRGPEGQDWGHGLGTPPTTTLWRRDSFPGQVQWLLQSCPEVSRGSWRGPSEVGETLGEGRPQPWAAFMPSCDGHGHSQHLQRRESCDRPHPKLDRVCPVWETLVCSFQSLLWVLQTRISLAKGVTSSL